MPAVPAIALGVAAVGTAASIAAQNKANKYAKQANEYQRNIDNLKQARARVQAIREARLKAGAVQQTAETQGVGNASAALGGLGSIASQLNSNLSFLDQTGRLADQASIATGKQIKAAGKAQMFGAIADLGMTVFSTADTLKKGN